MSITYFNIKYVIVAILAIVTEMKMEIVMVLVAREGK